MLSKIIAGFLLLIPALTLILSPLAVGIGCSAVYPLQWVAVWLIIGPNCDRIRYHDGYGPVSCRRHRWVGNGVLSLVDALGDV